MSSEEQNTNSIDGQPVSEYGYLCFQLWKQERFRVILPVALALICNFAILGGAFGAMSFLNSTHQCQQAQEQFSTKEVA